MQVRVGSLVRLLSFILLLGARPAFAIDLEPDAIRGKTQQSPVTILQNRYFTKSLRPELGLSYGTVTNEAYTDTSLLGLRGAFFLNEWMGIELQSLKASVKDSDDRRALNQLKYRKLDAPEIVSPDPEINRLKSVMDINSVLAPFYGKLNLADWLIVYSDVYFTAGIARVSTDQGDLNAVSFGVGQRFYWQKNLSLRVDFRDRVYNEKRNSQSNRKNTYSVDFGLSYFLF